MRDDYEVPENLRSLIERARRSGELGNMETHALVFSLWLGDDVSREAWDLRSKVSYELAIGYADRSPSVVEPLSTWLLKKAERYAEQAIQEGNLSDDPLNGGYALQVLGGHIYPRLGDWVKTLSTTQEGYKLGYKVALDPSTSAERVRRAFNLGLNCGIHLIRLAIKRSCIPHSTLGDMLSVLKQNPHYLERPALYQCDFDDAELFASRAH